MSASGPGSIRLHVDADLCQGHLRCYALAPDLFAIDDLGYATATDVEIADAGARQLAEDAMNACPERAIRIER